MNPPTIEAWQLCDYWEVRKVTEWRDGSVMRTEFVGYCSAKRPKGDDEVYSSLSMRPGERKTLAPFLG